MGGDECDPTFRQVHLHDGRWEVFASQLGDLAAGEWVLAVNCDPEIVLPRHRHRVWIFPKRISQIRDPAVTHLLKDDKLRMEIPDGSRDLRWAALLRVHIHQQCPAGVGTGELGRFVAQIKRGDRAQIHEGEPNEYGRGFAAPVEEEKRGGDQKPQQVLDAEMRKEIEKP